MATPDSNPAPAAPAAAPAPVSPSSIFGNLAKQFYDQVQTTLADMEACSAAAWAGQRPPAPVAPLGQPPAAPPMPAAMPTAPPASAAAAVPPAALGTPAAATMIEELQILQVLRASPALRQQILDLVQAALKTPPASAPSGG
jgi:hypothetical protein